MTVYRAKRNIALPGGVWKQTTDRELDPASDLARQLLAVGKIAPVGTRLVEEVRPAAPTYTEAVEQELATERDHPGTGEAMEPVDHPADGTLSPELAADGLPHEPEFDIDPDDHDDPPAPTGPPVAPNLVGFPGVE